MKETVIVTGGLGFIGTHLVNALVDDYNVHVIDDGRAASGIVNSKASAYYFFDITKCSAAIPEKVYKRTKCIFHLAAESRIGPCIEDPAKAFNTNVLGTFSLLQTARKYNIKRFIYSSTSSVYGDPKTLPISETHSLNCLNPYSSTKLAGEELVKAYTKAYGVDSCIFRYFNVYGPGAPMSGPYAAVMNIFLNQYKNNEPLTVVGTGEQTRDFIHVNDVVKANIKALRYRNRIKGEVFNVGTGQAIAVKTLAKKISDNVKYIPKRQGEILHSCANINKIQNQLNFKPTIKVLDWLKEQLHNTKK